MCYPAAQIGEVGSVSPALLSSLNNHYTKKDQEAAKAEQFQMKGQKGLFSGKVNSPGGEGVTGKQQCRRDYGK